MSDGRPRAVYARNFLYRITEERIFTYVSSKPTAKRYKNLKKRYPITTSTNSTLRNKETQYGISNIIPKKNVQLITQCMQANKLKSSTTTAHFRKHKSQTEKNRFFVRKMPTAGYIIAYRASF